LEYIYFKSFIFMLPIKSLLSIEFDVCRAWNPGLKQPWIRLTEREHESRSCRRQRPKFEVLSCAERRAERYHQAQHERWFSGSLLQDIADRLLVWRANDACDRFIIDHISQTFRSGETGRDDGRHNYEEYRKWGSGRFQSKSD